MGRSESIRRLADEATRGAGSPDAREAARRTGGVPVYEDVGGVLVVAPDGSVLGFDPERDSVSRIEDAGWRTLALVRAARQFHELEELRPVRPAGAVTCAACAGLGLLRDLETLDCGQCHGAGWRVR